MSSLTFALALAPHLAFADDVMLITMPAQTLEALALPSLGSHKSVSYSSSWPSGIVAHILTC